jgi:hypothetical protein
VDSRDEAVLVDALSPAMETLHSLCGPAAGITPITVMRASGA